MKFRNPGVFIGVCLLILAGGKSVVWAQDGREKSATWNYRHAEELITRRAWAQAAEALDICLQKDPGFVDAYYSRALVREHLNLDNQALTDLNIYLELRPQHYEALLSRAQLRMRLQQFDMAKTDFYSLLKLPSGETSAVFFQTDNVTGSVSRIFSAKNVNRAYLFNLIGLTDTKLGNLREAVVAFDSAIALSPTEADTWVNRGIARVALADTLGGIEDYRHALSVDPNHALAKHNLSLVRRKAEGATLLDQAIEDNPNMPFSWAERAYQRQKAGKWRDALADYNQAIRLNPNEKDYYLNRGLVKEKLRDYDGAYTDYTKAIELHERFEQAWLNRGNLLSRLGRLDEAIEDYTTALTWSPSYGAAWYNRALARHRLHQRDAACDDLQHAEKYGMNIPARAKAKICAVQ